MTEKSLGQVAEDAYEAAGCVDPAIAWEAAAEAVVHSYLMRRDGKGLLTPALASSMIDAGLDYFSGHPSLSWCEHCRSYREGECRCYDDD